MKLSALERETIIGPELKTLREKEALDKRVPQLEQVERVNYALRQKYGDKEFCFAAEFNAKTGEYDYFVDDVKVQLDDKTR